jgi:transposase-like protein
MHSRAAVVRFGYGEHLVDFHSNHGHPQSAGLHLPEGACLMSTMQAPTRESAVGLVLTEGMSIRTAADELGMPYHTLHGWVRAARRSGRKSEPKDEGRGPGAGTGGRGPQAALGEKHSKEAAAYLAREQP